LSPVTGLCLMVVWGCLGSPLSSSFLSLPPPIDSLSPPPPPSLPPPWSISPSGHAAIALQFLPQDVEEYLGEQVPLCMCQPIVVHGGETQIDLHVSNLSWANAAKDK